MLKDRQEAPYFTADCGHEVFDGETAYEFDAKTWCEDCIREELFGLETDELVRLVGGLVIEVKANV